MQKDILKRIFKELKSRSGLIILSLLCAVATVFLTLRIPVLIGRAVDCIVGQSNVDFDRLIDIMRQMSIFVCATFISQYAMNLINNKITYSVTRELRDRAFARLIKMPLSKIDTHPHGDYMSRIVADADTFADGLLLGFTQLFTGILTILCTIVFMLQISVKIALVVIILTPLSLFIAWFVSKRTYNLFKTQAGLKGKQTSLVEEMIDGEQVVQLFGSTGAVQSDFDRINDELTMASLKATFFSSLTNPSTRFVNALIYAGVTLFGAILAIGGGITVGGLTTFLSYASSYAKPFNEISGVITELQNALACGGRLFEVIDAEIEVEAEPYIVPENVDGDVELENVYFSYNKDKPLIEDLNLTVTPGMRVAIVGPTGSGKSTIINLIMRFYDTDKGRILLEGTDTKSILRKDLRNNFGMVLQETWLKAGTIRENLLFGNPNATEEEMIAAAKAAHAHSFIRRLPKGYDTYLAENGGSLSVGQKQLLCIARVMLNLPPILILDEATSSIDTRTEQRIQKGFNAMMEGRTSFVVAHRLSTIREADVILVVKDGKVVEQGSHSFLLQKNGFYATLYQSQFAE